MQAVIKKTDERSTNSSGGAQSAFAFHSHLPSLGLLWGRLARDAHCVQTLQRFSAALVPSKKAGGRASASPGLKVRCPLVIFQKPPEADWKIRQRVTGDVLDCAGSCWKWRVNSISKVHQGATLQARSTHRFAWDNLGQVRQRLHVEMTFNYFKIF